MLINSTAKENELELSYFIESTSEEVFFCLD